jgi:hypothetical protein
LLILAANFGANPIAGIIIFQIVFFACPGTFPIPLTAFGFQATPEKCPAKNYPGRLKSDCHC